MIVGGGEDGRFHEATADVTLLSLLSLSFRCLTTFRTPSGSLLRISICVSCSFSVVTFESVEFCLHPRSHIQLGGTRTNALRYQRCKTFSIAMRSFSITVGSD